MTPPASASFPWSRVPEPPAGEFRSGMLPGADAGSGYLAARGARSGPALLILAGSPAGYPAIHGLLRLAGALDAHRLAGSLLLVLSAYGSEQVEYLDELVDAADVLVVATGVPADWQSMSQTGYALTGRSEADEIGARLAAVSGAAVWFTRARPEGGRDPLSAMAGRGGIALSRQMPDVVDQRDTAGEATFQGTINMLRVLGMLEGRILDLETRRVEPPGQALAPLAGLWTPAVRLGQRLRVDDRLGSFHDLHGEELGDLLSNVAGIVLGFSAAVWVDAGDHLVELARPLD